MCFPPIVVLFITALCNTCHQICAKKYLVPKPEWVDKLLQLFQIQKINHGVMMVGPSGSGKSTAWQVLLEASEAFEGVKGEAYVLDPKVQFLYFLFMLFSSFICFLQAITKEQLFGSLDATTREWTDGLFTHTLRKIIDNVRGESAKRHWIIFDGDVDPEWVENLNSLLDDNKLLTLPNGKFSPTIKYPFIIFNINSSKVNVLRYPRMCVSCSKSKISSTQLWLL